MGRDAGAISRQLNPVERLCYIGTRGMGALEFHPTILKGPRNSQRLEIDALTRLANEVLNNRANLAGVLKGDDDHETLQEILRVGTSAGGARAKVIPSMLALPASPFRMIIRNSATGRCTIADAQENLCSFLSM